MIEAYNRAIANHYAAYRPPLHGMILEHVLSPKETFPRGLDIGCGTGYSTIALTKYCSHVYGIEPSESMLKEATTHEKISYLHGCGQLLPLTVNSIDIVTFAGSLFYSKSKELIEALKRVCGNLSVVIPYDFEVVMDDILNQCGVVLPGTLSGYDYEINFSGDKGFVESGVGREQLSLEAGPIELAHLLLSSRKRHDAFVYKYGAPDPYPLLVNELEQTNRRYNLKVNIFFSKYQLDSDA